MGAGAKCGLGRHRDVLKAGRNGIQYDFFIDPGCMEILRNGGRTSPGHPSQKRWALPHAGSPARLALQLLHRFARCNIQPRTNIPPLRTGDEARGDRHTDLQAPGRAHLSVATTTQQIGSVQRRHRFAIAIIHVLANFSRVLNLPNPAKPASLLLSGPCDLAWWHVTSQWIDRAPGLSATSAPAAMLAPATAPVAPSSPVPSTNSASAAVSSIDRIEERFANLEYDFKFPSSRDFPDLSTLPASSFTASPDLVYTNTKQPIRVYENALTGS